VTALLPLLLVAQAGAGPPVGVSGYVQPQYEVRRADDGTRDRALFRRMVVTIDAAPMAHWRAQFSVDAGPLASAGTRPVIKNASVTFTGWEGRGITLTIGNQKMPLSRPLLMS
jgi:hypothetical protein